MKFLLSAAALLLAAAVPAVNAQTNSSTISTLPLTALLPECSQTCMTTAITDSLCSHDDQACICSDEKLQIRASQCVEKACSIKESLFTSNATHVACGAEIRDRRDSLRITATVLGTLSGVFVVVRVLARVLIIGGPLGADDWCIVATLLAGIPDTAMIVHGAIENGLGLDVWTLPSETITEFGRWFFIIEVTYFALIAMTKMSLLFFYLRIFPAKGIRRLLWATVVFNAVYGVVFILIGIFQCSPVQFFWERWDEEHSGTCLDINAIPWANGVVSIALDFWMLALPLSQLRELKLHWKKKVGVGLMFGVGTFVTVVSILRLQSMVEFASSNNPTWDHWDLTNWSTIEINVGIMCACLPSLRLLLVRMFPRMGGSSDRYGSKEGHYDAGAGTRGVSRPMTAGGAGLAGEGVELGSSLGGKKQQARQASRDLGVHSTVDRGSIDEDVATVKGGITYSRSYKVSYGDHDEESLVETPSSRGSSSPGRGRNNGERPENGEGRGDESGGNRMGGHGYHRRFHMATGSKASSSTLSSLSVEKIPESVV